MKWYKYGRLFITAGVLLGLLSLFNFHIGAMQNFYGTLLLTIGLFFLRKENRWNKISMLFSAITLVVLLVTTNTFLQGIAGLWTIGTLTMFTYCSVVLAMRFHLQTNRHKATSVFNLTCALIVATHIVFMLSHTIHIIGWAGLAPVAAQLCMLLLLWFYGFRSGNHRQCENS